MRILKFVVAATVLFGALAILCDPALIHNTMNAAHPSILLAAAGGASVFSLLKPYAVTFEQARQLLADKGRNQVYELIKAGKLEAIRDGAKTLITVRSIEAYMTGLPRAELAEPPELVAGKEKARIEAEAAAKKKRRPAKRRLRAPGAETTPQAAAKDRPQAR
jgi:hypothetical protein